eukprot:3248798-Pleurochrysis_carterae.AAC.2
MDARHARHARTQARKRALAHSHTRTLTHTLAHSLAHSHTHSHTQTHAATRWPLPLQCARFRTSVPELDSTLRQLTSPTVGWHGQRRRSSLADGAMEASLQASRRGESKLQRSNGGE